MFTYRWYQRGKSERATVKVVKALNLVERPVLHDDPMQPPLPGEETFATEAERTAAVLDAIAKAGPARGAAALVEAQLLLRGGKVDEALAMFRKRASASGIDGLIAREGVGIALEAKATASTDAAARQKLLEEALTAFRAIQPDEKGTAATTPSITRPASSRSWASRPRRSPRSSRRWRRCPAPRSSR